MSVGKVISAMSEIFEPKYINLKTILFHSVLGNKTIFFGTLILFLGYYLQDTLFTRYVASITRDIPSFVQDVNLGKIIKVLSPFIAAIIIFYLANIVISNNLSKIELNVTQQLSDQVIESVKTTKKKINVNEMLIQIKKVTNMKNMYRLVALSIIPTIVVIMSLLYNFVKVDIKSATIVLILIIMLILFTIFLESITINAVYEEEQSLNTLYDTIHETMINIDTVITSSSKGSELSNINKIKDKTYDLSYISELKNNNTTYGLQLLILIVAFAINYIAYTLYMEKKISVDVLAANVLLTLLFMDYYTYCVNAMKEVISNIGKLYDANLYFSSFNIIPETRGKEKLVVKQGDIKLKNIIQKYNDKFVFNNVSFEIDGNSKIGIIGPIGSGKSTLLKMISGIADYEGDIFIDDQNIKECTYESLTNNIAYISQHPKLFNKSILYNITYGTQKTKDEVIKKLNDLGLMEFINSFQNGLDTVVGKEGSSVSGGQRQFISFIRAIIQNKTIILLDEPSSSLDIKSKQILLSLIKKLAQATIIITTHDKELLPIFDKIIDNPSKQGKTYEIKPHNEIQNTLRYKVI